MTSTSIHTTLRQSRRTRVYGCIVLFLAIFGFILWRFRQAPTSLERYRAQLLAQGEVLDLDKLAPKRTGNEPDGDLPLNDAAAQISHGLAFRTDQFLPSINTNNLLLVTWPGHPKATNQTQRAALWTQAETDVENRRAELIAASLLLQNPPNEKGADYRDTLHYPRVNFVQRRSLAQLFSSATLADIHAGRSSQSVTNLVALLNLCDLHREEWTFLNQMIRIAISRLTLNTVAYGLAAQQWTEPDLARLQARLESLSIVTNTYQSLLYLRAQGVTTFSLCRTNSSLIATNMFGGRTGVREYLQGLYWVNANLNADELNFLQFSQNRLDFFRQQLKSPAWAGAPDLLQAQAEAAFADTSSGLLGDRHWLSSLLSPNLSKAMSSLIITETLRLQTITATALERYHLKHGLYPDTLSKLIPDYLTQIPSDPMDGRPLRYRLNPAGTFTLWSIGFDGKDDGGDPNMPNPQKQSFPQDAKDLVWPKIDPMDLPPKK